MSEVSPNYDLAGRVKDLTTRVQGLERKIYLHELAHTEERNAAAPSTESEELAGARDEIRHLETRNRALMRELNDLRTWASRVNRSMRELLQEN